MPVCVRPPETSATTAATVRCFECCNDAVAERIYKFIELDLSGGRVPVTAKLSRKFYERLGDDIAAELVDWFNAVDAAYKSELKATNDLNWERFKDHLDSQMNALRADLMKWMFIYWSGTVAAIIGMGYFGPK
jgi:hypothetical protein